MLRLTGSLLLLVLLACLTACSEGSAIATDNDTPLVKRPLPGLPLDGPAWSRQVSAVTTKEGAATFMTSGEPGAHVHTSFAELLTLDGNSGVDLAWAIWQLPVTAETEVQKLQINLYLSGNNRFHFAVANYATGKWIFPSLDDFPDGTKGNASLELGVDDGALHSPGENIYVAALVLPGSIVHIQNVEMTVEDTGGGNDDPIYDQYEDNDELEIAKLVPLGELRASIHETVVLEMSDPNEIIDTQDFYIVPVEAGQTLTVTMLFEAVNRFPEVGHPTLNDLDLLLYPPGSTLELDQFNDDDDAFGAELYFYPFEQGTWTVGAGGDYMIGIIAREPGHDNAEYDLNIFVSDNAYEVTGFVTKEGAQVTERFVVYLEPGNFNAVTSLDPEFPGDAGKFSIKGVPNGGYTLKVHSSASFHEDHPFTWPETKSILVIGSDVTDASIDIGPEPEL